MNKLYFGDNLDILREHIRDETVDLVYLDPPFNSNANYNVLFKSPKGHESTAQIHAFEDTWHWNEQAEREFGELVRQLNTDVSEMMQALRRFLGENDMMAYLTMMANRLLELHRVLKPTGSLYLHCDPTASHYLKIVLDGVFGKESFRNEIVWKRKAGRGETNNAAVRFGVSHDALLFYAKSSANKFFRQYRPNSQHYIDTKFVHDDGDGRLYRLDNLTSPSFRSNLRYEYKGYPPPEKGWAVAFETMERMDEDGRIYFPKDKTKRLQRKRFLDELEGETVDTLWDDISPINSQAQERLGYPHTKPLALLERIINASSNEGDVVLDPFCGCGTAVHAAQKLKRQWMGIDITHLAVSLIEKRLRDAFPDIRFEVEGTPKDLEGARNLAERDKYQFQWWACSLVNAQPYQGKKKGADGGIDGLIYFNDDGKLPKKIIVSVKGGENVSRTMVADLKNAVEREKAQLGLFVTLAAPTRPMNEEASAAGFYDSPAGASFPKIQILTIEGLLTGSEQARYPDLARGGLTFKQAKVEEKAADQKKLFS